MLILLIFKLIIERLKSLNKTTDRVKVRLTEELADYKKKFRDQQRATKEAEDKYIRFKDLLVKAKSTINKVSDEISCELRRGAQLQASNVPKTPKVEGEKAPEVIKKSVSAKESVEEKKDETSSEKETVKENEKDTELVKKAIDQNDESVVVEDDAKTELAATDEAILIE